MTTLTWFCVTADGDGDLQKVGVTYSVTLLTCGALLQLAGIKVEMFPVLHIQVVLQSG